MTRRKKTAQITVRIDSSLKDAAERAAAKDHRSLGSLIERPLVKHLRSRGLLNVPQRQPKEAARTILKLALVRWTQLAMVRCQPRNEKSGNSDYFTVQRNSAASAATNQSRCDKPPCKR